MSAEHGFLRPALRTLCVAGIAAAGLATLVGSGGGIGFPLCTESWCKQPPPPEATVDPPYATAQVGSAVVFTVKTAHFSGSPSFQWSRYAEGRGFVALPGQTGPTLTLPAVNLGDDQAIYRVQVSGAEGLPRWADAVLTVSSAPGIVFRDGDFEPARWQARPREVAPGILPATSDAREATGGNPDAWRRMSYRIPAGAGSASVIYLRPDAAYDPAVHGAIYVVDHAEDCRMLQASETMFVESQLVVEQAGRHYVASGGGICTSTEWNAAPRRSSLRASDFRIVDGPACGTAEACPDFSASAPALRLGYQRSVWGMPGDTIGHGIDNWTVTVWRR